MKKWNSNSFERVDWIFLLQENCSVNEARVFVFTFVGGCFAFFPFFSHSLYMQYCDIVAYTMIGNKLVWVFDIDIL